MDKKLSGEFAIAVILIIAGTFAYIFWKGANGIPVGEGGAPVTSFVTENESVSDEQEKADKNWKLFRNDSEGYELSLPENWRLKEDGGRFTTEGETEEISVVIEENEKKYSADQLLAETMAEDGEANIQPLSEGDGIKIEKREDDILKQTAKIIRGEDVITLTYMGGNINGPSILFDEILPMFRAIN